MKKQCFDITRAQDEYCKEKAKGLGISKSAYIRLLIDIRMKGQAIANMKEELTRDSD